MSTRVLRPCSAGSFDAAGMGMGQSFVSLFLVFLLVRPDAALLVQALWHDNPPNISVRACNSEGIIPQESSTYLCPCL